MNFLVRIFPAVIAFTAPAAFAQQVTPRLVCQMPDSIPESSGLCSFAPNRIYTHNDSGDLPRIFTIDTSGNLLRTVYLAQAGAVDYEDITRDPAGNVYIGDFGNNLNLRSDLRIYKIPDPETLPGDTAVAETIGFSYPDQLLFPPPVQEQNFDCEAFFFLNDSLYLFSKNRGTSPYSKMYRLPAQPGNYVAALVDSFYTGTWVTSASLSPDGGGFVLLAETQLWLYKRTGPGDFDASSGIRILLNHAHTQKEAITFADDTTLYISDERYAGTGGNLYCLSLGKWINTPVAPLPFTVQAINNPSQDSFTLQINGTTSYTVELFDLAGKIVDRVAENVHQRYFTYARRQAGILFARVTSDHGEVKTTTVLIF